jgi:putative ABC transport system substrate-binding protein
MELAIHDLDRNEAQGVVDEVGRHVGKHDESGNQADPPDHARVTDREYGLGLHLGSFAPTNEYRKSPDARLETERYRHAARQIDQILKGRNPEEIPVYQTSKLQIVINLKTAKALGLTVRPALLVAADEVIE